MGTGRVILYVLVGLVLLLSVQSGQAQQGRSALDTPGHRVGVADWADGTSQGAAAGSTQPGPAAQGVRYAYDKSGRLVAVIDQQGHAAIYDYDAVGNLLAIRRRDATPPVDITLVNPNVGVAGTQVEIFGTGFSPVAAENQAAFNGVAAPVLAASANRLVTEVPAGATSGPITVTTPSGAAVSPEPFTILDITISPAEAEVIKGDSLQLNATIIGTDDQRMDWTVNDIPGGNAVVGTITPQGFYTAPVIGLTPRVVTIQATSVAFPEVAATATITVIRDPSLPPCTVFWDGERGDGLWQTAANWSTDTLPGPLDDACIDLGFSVTLSGGSHSVQSLVIEGILTLTGGSLNVSTTVEIKEQFILAGGTLRNATVVPGPGGQQLTFTTSGGVLDGVTMEADLDLTGASNTHFRFINGLTLNGRATLGSGNQYGRIFFQGTQTLGGTGEIVFGTSPNNGLLPWTSTGQLTIGPEVTVRGRSGAVGGGGSSSVVNQGVIRADEAGGTITLNGAGWRNEGTLAATGGGALTLNGSWSNTGTVSASEGSTLTLNGTFSNTGSISSTDAIVNLGGSPFTQADLGTFVRSGGTVNLTGRLNNTGVLALDQSTGSWRLLNGSIVGGTVTAADGAGLVLTTSGGVLDGVTVNADLDLTGASNTHFRFINGLTLNGRATLGSGNQYGRIFFQGTQTLGGTGEIVFGTSANNGLLPWTSTGQLTIGPEVTVRGRSGAVGGGGSSSMVNQGVIRADEAGGTITLNGAGWRNEGTMSAVNGGDLTLNGSWSNTAALSVTGGGTLTLNGTFSNTGAISATDSTVDLSGDPFTLADLGTFVRSGGTVNLTGRLNNTGTLALDQSTGSWRLLGGSIVGGTVTAAEGVGLTPTTSGGVLDGVTVNADLDLTGASNTHFRFINGLTLNGRANLGSGNLYGRIFFQGTQTLGGTGEIVFGTSANNGLLPWTSSEQLTIGPGITVRGHTGAVGSSSGSSSIVNQGVIRAEEAGGTITLNGANWRNEGTLAATGGGTLTLNGTFSSTGSITATESTVNLNANPFTQGDLGSFTRTGGTVNLTGRLTGGLALDQDTGSWRLLNGTIVGGTVTGVDGAELLLTTSGGILDGVTVNTDLDLTGASNTHFRFINGLTLNGRASLGSGNLYGRIYFQGTQTLGGTGEIVFVGTSGNNGLLPWSSSEQLTIGPGVTVRGQSGAVGGGGSSSIVNQGVIRAEEAGGTITLNGANWRNEGTLAATGGGTLTLNGTFSSTGSITATESTVNLNANPFTQGDLGSFTRTGGTVNLTGRLTGGLALDQDTGSWRLLNGTIVGGTVTGVDGAELLLTTSGGILDGVTVNTDLDLTGASNTHFRFINGLTLNGRASLGSGNLYGRIYFQGTQTLGGTGEIVFVGTSGNNGLLPWSSSEQLTIGPGVTVRGQSGAVGGGGSSSIVNQGVIRAEEAGGTITLNGANWRNEGTLAATGGGTLTLNGTFSSTGSITATESTVNLNANPFTQGDLGSFTRTGGTVNLTGRLTGGLALDQDTGSWRLLNGTIVGGTVTGVDGAELLLTTSGGILDGVTVNTDLDLTGASNTHFRFINGLTLNGRASLGSGNLYGRIYFQGTQTLGGTGEIVFVGTSGNNGLLPWSSSEQLTIGPGVTVRGQSGAVGGGGSSSIVNQGVIRAEEAGGTITLNGANWRNEGTLAATGGGRLASNIGNYTQTASGVLGIEIGGTRAGTDFSQINLSGAATLDGTLNIALAAGFEPDLGSNFQIMSFGSRSGEFATIGGLEIGNNKRFEAAYTETSLTLTVVSSS